MNPIANKYFLDAPQWNEELIELRKIVLGSQLTEMIKWGVPCYVFQESNVVLLGAFKAFCSISFFKGSLMKDPNGILLKPGENSQSARMIKFTHLDQIRELEPVIKTYILEAIEIEKTGLKPIVDKSMELAFPEELLQILDKDAAFKAAFAALTPGRQRGYNLFFTAAKQPATRISRIEKYRQQILDGKGINDCTCGLSKKMPSCDGSHKAIR
ncbi:MAG: DUF1801 domain-containing protein [Chitinophagaceae bacterium]|jgi:uncharacterized protein YdeI (YjbR/CyaY-like superfamily)|nr:DUF1801 domain-containing protein [Chitinophagaceae bacterium]